MIGKVISHYEILEKLGEGGMGVVYKAIDTKLNRFIALKFLRQEFTRDVEAKERFIREAQAASALDHPNICTIYEINETKPTPDSPEESRMYICMAYYDAETLKQKIENGSLSIDEAIEITLQICRGLSKAHKQGLIHRDIKPANILITNDELVKIVDFGLAKLEGQTRLTKEKSTMGTVAYLSPEQASGTDVDTKTDIWALGVMLYEMLTGKLPFKGDIDQVMLYSILHEEPVSPTILCPDMPKVIEQIILKALQKEPDQRYQLIRHMEKDCKKLQDKTGDINIPDYSADKTRKSLNDRIKKGLISATTFLVLFLIFLLLKPVIFRNSSVKGPVPVAVIGFQNQTGNDAYDYLQEAIPNLLITSLEQSPHLQVTTWERMYDLLKQIGRQDVKLIDKETGFELCRFDGIDVVITGSYIKADNVFMTDVKVLNVNTKEIITSASSQGEGVASILTNQIDDLSREISQGVGLSKQIFRKTHVELAEVTTSSIDAYRNFLQGREKYEKSYWEDAIPLLQEAIELDSTFSMAYLYLARAYWNLYQSIKGGNAFELAKKYSYKTTEKERLYIEEASYYFLDEKRYNILKELTENYPKEKRAHFKLGDYYQGKKLLAEAVTSFNRSLELDPDYGPALKQLAHTYMNIGDYDHALEIQKRFIEISSDDAEPLVGLGNILFRMGKLDEAIAEYEEALRIKPDFYFAYIKISYCYGLKSDFRQSLHWIERYEHHALSEGPMGEVMWWKAYYLKWLAQYDSSITESNNMIQLAQSFNEQFGVAMAKFLIAGNYYENQEFQASRLYYKDAFDEFLHNDSLFFKQCHNFYRGIIFLHAGKMDSTRKLINEIQSTVAVIKMQNPWREEPLNILSKILEVEYLLAEGKAREAVAAAKKISPEQIPVIPSMDFLFYNLAMHNDILARAYIESGELKEAIKEYEHLTEFQPNSNDRRLVYPLYHYNLAGLYQQKGLNDKAENQYGIFLKLWENADTDRPELNIAKQQLELLNTN